MLHKFCLYVMIAVSILPAALSAAVESVRAEQGESKQINLTVTARVKGYCRISQVAAPSLDFGKQDGLSGEETITRETTIAFACSKDIPFEITLGNGNHYGSGRKMKHASREEYVPYDLAVSPAAGTGKGTAAEITSTLAGSVQKAALKSISVGDYNDAVIITIEAKQ